MPSSTGAHELAGVHLEAHCLLISVLPALGEGALIGVVIYMVFRRIWPPDKEEDPPPTGGSS